MTKSISSRRSIRVWLVLLLIAVICRVSTVQADRPGWQRKEVNWRMTGGSRIRAVHYPLEKPLLTRQNRRRPKAPRKKTLPAEAAFRLATLAHESTAPIVVNVIDSPPVDGFVPWIAVAVTDEREDELDMIFEATPRNSVIGNYLTGYPQSDYVIGIFDTGASAHVMGNIPATRVGLFDADLITSNTVVVAGVAGSVDTWISQPIGLFIDGLGAIEPDGLLLDTSGMVGQTNVAIAVGQGGSPDLPTAIGSPLSVYFTAAFSNDQQITVIHDGNELTAPDIHFYDHNDPCIPNYSNVIPLELRPLGGVSAQYIPTLDLFDPSGFSPASPSVIIGNLSQSIFFVHSVDLTDGNNSAIDKDRFMFDTGAQITVVGSRIAARLALVPAEPEFEVEIYGVSGDTIIAPGFYIDSLQIPAIGEWLRFTNVPVILLDVFSPEGGTVDGIIGMNLFVDFNFVFRGGGLFLQDDPTVEFEPIAIIADIAPGDGDGIVDFLDLAAFVEAWLATSNPPSANWNPKCDMAPYPTPDGKVNLLDFAVLADYWLESTAL